MKFDHLKKLETKGKTTEYSIHQIEGEPILILRPANESNKGYFNSILRKSRRNLRNLRAGAINEKLIAENREQDRVLFPKHVIVDWKDMPDGDGNSVPFSPDTCEEFLRALPNWIFDEIRAFAGNNENFYGETMAAEDIASD